MVLEAEAGSGAWSASESVAGLGAGVRPFRAATAALGVVLRFAAIATRGRGCDSRAQWLFVKVAICRVA